MSTASQKSHVQRILELHQRERFRVGKASASLRLMALRSAYDSILPNQSELLRYFPIALISCVETFFKNAIKELVDYGEPYLSNAQSLMEKGHYNYEILTALHGQKITIGDLISHHIRINNLPSLISIMSGVMDLKFRDKVATAVDRWIVEVEQKEAVPIISDIEVTFKHVSETFRLRHIFCHEVAHGVTISKEEVSEFIEHIYFFFHASQCLIDDTIYPNAPLTQTDMNIEASNNLSREKKILEELILKATENLSEDQKKQFEIANTAWNTFLEASIEVEGLEYEGGSIRPTIEGIAGAHLTKERQEQIKSLIKYHGSVTR